MGSGGGGGDNGMMMMMMMLQMQQQQEQQRRQMEQQAFEASQKAEQQGYQRYSDQVTSQSKKVADQWDLYNANMDKILKLNPQYNAHKKYTFQPYAVNPQYTKSTNKQQADENTDNLNKWYSDLDRQAFDDLTTAKGQYEGSKTWLSEVQAAKDAQNRILPGAPPGTWGAGGEQVSGQAGADSLGGANATGMVGGGANSDIYNIAGGLPGASSTGGNSGSNVGMGGAGVAGTGFLSDGNSPSSSLAGVFGQAVGGMPNQNKTGAGSSIF